jgi:hypothetical protein
MGHQYLSRNAPGMEKQPGFFCSFFAKDKAKTCLPNLYLYTFYPSRAYTDRALVDN